MPPQITPPSPRQAEELLHQGKLEGAGKLHDEILIQDEKDVDLTAAHHYSRGLDYELEFLPGNALSHYAKAYQYRPENLTYAFSMERSYISKTK